MAYFDRDYTRVAAMSFSAEVIKVLIASPSDVAEERRAMRDTILDWNVLNAQDRGLVLMPIMWETHASPLLGDRPQKIINKQVVSDCDLLVAAFWTRLGSPTGIAPSGTVEEIEGHHNSGKPAMVYFSTKPVALESIDQSQHRALKAFKKKCQDEGLIEFFDSVDEFKVKFARQLSLTINREFTGLGTTMSGRAVMTDRNKPFDSPQVHDRLSPDARVLLTTAAGHKGGVIMLIESNRGTDIQAGDTNLIVDQTSREVAQWRAALAELLRHDLIEDTGNTHGEYFEVTHAGYLASDKIAPRSVSDDA